MVSWCWLVKVITSKDVPPALMADGEKVLATVGGLSVTVSTSEAEHTTGDVAVLQPGEELVLTTPDGGVIETVLVTWV